MNQIINPEWQEPLLFALRVVLAFCICAGIVMLAVSAYCDAQEKLGKMLTPDDGFEMDNDQPPVAVADAARLMSSEQINKIVASYMKPLPATTNRTSMHTPPLLREQMDLIRKPTNNGE